MKKYLIVIALFSMLFSCQERNLVGYVVFKKHIPKHMCCDDNVKEVVEAGVIIVPHPVVVAHHHHEEQSPTWTLYVGNAWGTNKIEVTPSCYNKFHVTDKVKVYGNNVKLIKRGCR